MFNFPASSYYSEINTFLSPQIINRRLNPSVVVHAIRVRSVCVEGRKSGRYVQVGVTW
jgi:hypothetical protein